jgi:hypothetical protein
MTRGKMAKGPVLSPQEAVERGREYVEGYFQRIGEAALTDDESPEFARGGPYEVRCHPLESGGLLLLIKRDERGGFKAVDRGAIKTDAYDHTVHLHAREAGAGYARSRGAADAERDCALSSAIASLEKAGEEARAMLESTEALLKTNPWLDEFASSSIEASGRLVRLMAENAEALRSGLNGMTASYRSSLAEISSSLAMVEAVAATGDAPLSKRNNRLGEMEEEQEARWKRAERELAVLSEVAKRVDAAVDELEALKVKVSKEMDESGGSKKVRDNLSALVKSVETLDSEILGLKDDVKVSREIRDTLFRDSKRLHNINERLNAVESHVGSGGFESKVAELKRRLDAMERRMDTEITLAVREALASQVAQQQPPAQPQAARAGKTNQERKKR